MKYIHNPSLDTRYNLALYEYILRYWKQGSYLIIFENKNSIIVGRHQNTFAEVNQNFVDAHDVAVVRRIAGGGAVYHDEGNINVVFITDKRDKLNQFQAFTAPIIEALREMGVPAEFKGRNDIVADGKKISGNTQVAFKDRIMHGGSVLFDTDLDALGAALTPSAKKTASKGVQSIRQRVRNIKPYLDLDKNAFKARLAKKLLGHPLDACLETLDEEDMRAINTIRRNRYDRWEWNYGRSPASSVVKEARFKGGLIEIHLKLKKGRIQGMEIFGDFFTRRDLAPLKNAFRGAPYEKKAVDAIIKRRPPEDFFFQISTQEFRNCLFQ